MTKLKCIGICMLWMLIGMGGTDSALGMVHTYPVPQGETLSPDYEVFIDGQRVDVATIQVGEAFANPPYSFGSMYSYVQFDLNQPVEIMVKAAGLAMDHVAVLPQSRNISIQKLSPDTIRFSINGPTKLSIEPAGRCRPLLLFANSLENNAPKPGDPKVIYFAPGIHRPPGGSIEVKSGETVYLAGGAVVEAGIHAANANNITIRGRGVLSGDRWAIHEGPVKGVKGFVNFVNCRNVRMEGIVLRGAYDWTVVPQNCEGVDIQNIKICNLRVRINDDGIDLCNSRHVKIQDVFIRTADDTIAVKGLKKDWGPVDDVVVENSILWSDLARIVLLGHESRASKMENIGFRNIDVIHTGQWPFFLFEPGDDMLLRNVRVEDVRIHAEGNPPGAWYGELTPPQWTAVIRPNPTQYASRTWGRIEDIRFKNITVEGPPGKYVFLVEAAADHRDRRMKNITFENVLINGRRMTMDSPEFIMGPWVNPENAISVK